MALKDRNVITAATGFVYTGSIGLTAPTPDEIEAFDPNTFGSAQYDLTVTASTGTYELTVDSEAATIPFDATASAIQTALEALASVGAGGVNVANGEAAGEFVVTFTGVLQGIDPGLTPDVGATVAPKSVLNGWTMVGHTSRSEMPEFGVDGGDTEIRGTWQNVSLKQVQTETPSDYVILNLVQIDRTSMILHYGPETGAPVPGMFRYSGNPSASERSFLVVIVDGDINLGFHAAKCAFRRSDSIAMPVDDFMSLPTQATFLKHGANDMFSWISKDLFD